MIAQNAETVGKSYLHIIMIIRAHWMCYGCVTNAIQNTMHYKKFPDSRLASRYSGNDRSAIWLANVTQFYGELN